MCTRLLEPAFPPPQQQFRLYKMFMLWCRSSLAGKGEGGGNVFVVVSEGRR